MNRSSLQNFFIIIGEEVILIDTDFQNDMKALTQRHGDPLYMGEKLTHFSEVFAALGYKPKVNNY